MPEINLIDVKEMARRLSVSHRTLCNWANQHQIPFIKVRRALRFDPDAVMRSSRHYSVQDGSINKPK
jgi:excisionase family DNA binding protein